MRLEGNDSVGMLFMAGRSGTSTIDEFHTWRRERPFWGGLLMILASFVIGWIPIQFTFELLLIGGGYTVIGLVFAVLVFLSGVFALLRPDLARIVGISGIVFSLLSLIGALGGLVVGLLMGVIGGNLCLAWQPPEGTEAARSGSGADRRIVGASTSGAPEVGRQQETTAPTATSDDRGQREDEIAFSWEDDAAGQRSGQTESERQPESKPEPEPERDTNSETGTGRDRSRHRGRRKGR